MGGTDSEFSSSNKTNNLGSSEGSSMGMAQGSRKNESFVDKAIDGAADYARSSGKTKRCPMPYRRHDTASVLSPVGIRGFWLWDDGTMHD